VGDVSYGLSREKIHPVWMGAIVCPNAKSSFSICE
jgi:hypothetical protein